MIGHIGISVPDLTRAKAYYDQLMPLLAFDEFLNGADQFAYRPAGGKPGTFLFFYPAADGTAGYSRDHPGLQHLAFMVGSRSAVRAVHERVVSLGDVVVEEPRNFPEYPPPYYATFWRDPFGFLLEAVCHRERD
ncbi:VOC family protein [Nonomuraea sp. NPDC049141]|uniref:VOC family protein n=1 Tax=unclassified Nonomuraea TaxID=2593643 RepID=UPI0033D48EDC